MHFCNEEIFDKELEELSPHLRFYYDCLMKPNARSVLTALKKVKDLEYSTIATGHGPLLRYNVEEIVGRHVLTSCGPSIRLTASNLQPLCSSYPESTNSMHTSLFWLRGDHGQNCPSHILCSCYERALHGLTLLCRFQVQKMEREREQSTSNSGRYLLRRVWLCRQAIPDNCQVEFGVLSCPLTLRLKTLFGK